MASGQLITSRGLLCLIVSCFIIYSMFLQHTIAHITCFGVIHNLVLFAAVFDRLIRTV